MMKNPACLIKSVLPARKDEKFLRVVCLSAPSGGSSPHSGIIFPETGQSARVFPGNHPIRLKSVLRGDLPGEYELMVKGVRGSALKVGGIIAAVDFPVEECREALVLPSGGSIGSGSSVVRVQGGLHVGFNARESGCFIPEAEIRPYKVNLGVQLIHLSFSRPYPLFLGAELQISRTSDITAKLTDNYKVSSQSQPPTRAFSARVALLGTPPFRKRFRRNNIVNGLGSNVVEQIIHVNMALMGFVLLPSYSHVERTFVLALEGNVEIFPDAEQNGGGKGNGKDITGKGGHEEINTRESPGGKVLTEVQTWLITRKKLEESRLHIHKGTRRCGGVHYKALSENLPDAGQLNPLLTIALDMVRAGDIQKKGEWFFSLRPAALPPFYGSLLEKVKICGYNGLSVRGIGNIAESRALEEMKRSGFVCGGNSFWLAREILEKISERLLGNIESGTRLAMTDVKDCLGGSRAFRIEVVSILEEEGLLSPLQDSMRTVQ